MGKRKSRGEFGCKSSTAEFSQAQKLKSREFVNSDVWNQWAAASLELNKHNPSPTKDYGIVEVDIWISREAAARELNKRNPKSRLVISETGVLDKSPEASKMKKYASYAISDLAKGGPSKKDVELVQIGPLSVRDLSGTHRILHFNFKAKTHRRSGSAECDAVLVTYFCELTETTHGDHVHFSDLRCSYVAPSKLLPEKADTVGCLYCSSCNIHHPESPDAFKNGRKEYIEDLASKLKELRKPEMEAAFTKRFADPGFECIEETTEVTLDRCASVALRVYNGKQGSNYELVKTGEHKMVHIKLGFVLHLNFEARNGDGEVETFFAQAFPKSRCLLVDFCSCLGPTYLLPDEADIQGCRFCKYKAAVHHPPGPGYLIGRGN